MSYNPLKVSLENIIPLTEARDHFSQIVNEVQKDKLYVLTKGGKPAVAIIDVKYLERITGGEVHEENIEQEILKAPEKVGRPSMIEHKDTTVPTPPKEAMSFPSSPLPPSTMPKPAPFTPPTSKPAEPSKPIEPSKPTTPPTSESFPKSALPPSTMPSSTTNLPSTEQKPTTPPLPSTAPSSPPKPVAPPTPPAPKPMTSVFTPSSTTSNPTPQPKQSDTVIETSFGNDANQLKTVGQLKTPPIENSNANTSGSSEGKNVPISSPDLNNKSANGTVNIINSDLDKAGEKKNDDIEQDDKKGPAQFNGDSDQKAKEPDDMMID